MNSPAITRSVRTSVFSVISRAAIRHPRAALLGAALVTLAAVPGLRGIKLRTDGHALVSPDAPEVLYDKSIRDKFNLEDQIVVLISTKGSDGIFNPGTVQLVRELTGELMRLPGVNPSNVMSLATEPSFLLRPGSLIHQTLLEPALRTKAELDELREDLRRIELYNGTVGHPPEILFCSSAALRAAEEQKCWLVQVRSFIHRPPLRGYRKETHMSQTNPHGKICYIEMPATDVKRSSEFYEKVFGWRIRRRGDGSIAFDDPTGGVSGAWKLGRPPSTAPGLLIYIWCDSVANTLEALTAAGAQVVQPIGADAPEITARFRDPGGNIIGLYQSPG